MTTIDQRLTDAVLDTFESLFDKRPALAQIQIQTTRQEFEGDRTLVVFPLAGLAGKPPHVAAQMLGEALVESCDWVDSFDVVKGFLNLTLSTACWKESLTQALASPSWGHAQPGSRSKVMVEYSSPNTNKPLHLGHLRNNFLGFSVANILEAAGHEVVKVQIINDRGIHICKSMVAWLKMGNGETPESSGLKGDKLVGKYYVAFDKQHKHEVLELTSQGLSTQDAEAQSPILREARAMLQRWEEGDSEVVDLWRTMNGWVYDGFEETYRAMGVTFDKLYYESDTYLLGKKYVEEGLAKGVFHSKEDGSVWVDLTEDGLDQKLLLRGDGTAVYMTQDIGTAILRFEDYPGLDRQIYTVGNEQEYHFKVLFLVLAKLGFAQADRNHHLSYGMVELPEGKMKSREGTVVDADDLLLEMRSTARDISDELGKTADFSEQEKEELARQVGHGALKYFLLKVSPGKSMMFDPKSSIDFFGNTAPFIQFNVVRCKSILRSLEVDLSSLTWSDTIHMDSLERQLAWGVISFPDIVLEAAEAYDPSHIANHCYDLIKVFSSFYQDHPISKEENPDIRSMRLALCALTASTVTHGMHMLGIELPDRM
ncbi:MAG: arginine--tRNA ligase [Bacteroidetes bacterium]|nr:arginine--tRNA ligase [Bacteroidota bacterium]MDA0904217.1 arginine--tRNA ligase [Bacteroidota bacterium]MDA1242967.1 arginine--tRNA ligase [Bacteroidota bacterium]